MDHDIDATAQQNALHRALRTAEATSRHWTQIAAELTELRRHGRTQLPPMPDPEQWHSPYAVPLPFEPEDLRDELAALSGLITKAHTLAVIYDQHADHLSQWLTENALPPNTPVPYSVGDTVHIHGETWRIERLYTSKNDEPAVSLVDTDNPNHGTALKVSVLDALTGR